MEDNKIENVQQPDVSNTVVQEPASMENFSSDGLTEVGANKKMFLFLGAILLVLTLLLTGYLIAKKRGILKTTMQKATVQEKSKETTPIPTISDDTSIDTIEKEINSLNAEGLDQGDSAIEQDLRNL